LNTLLTLYRHSRAKNALPEQRWLLVRTSTTSNRPFWTSCSHYVQVGVEELDQEKLTPLLRLKHHNSITDALADLGQADEIGIVFATFQKYLYQPQAIA
jgi:hypothetical protein